MSEAHKIDVVVSAIDKASAPLKRITGGFDLLSKQGLMAGATFAVVNKGMDMLVSSFDNFIQYIQKGIEANREFEYSMMQLQNTITDFGTATIPQLKDDINSFRIIFGESMETVTGNMQKLLREGFNASDAEKIYYQINKLSKVFNDDLASGIETVTNIMDVFDYDASDVTTIVSKLNQIMSKTNMSFSDIGKIFSGNAGLLREHNMSIEDAIAVMYSLHEQGYRNKRIVGEFGDEIKKFTASSLRDVVDGFSEWADTIEDVNTKFSNLQKTAKYQEDVKQRVAEIIRENRTQSWENVFSTKSFDNAMKLFDQLKEKGITTVEEFKASYKKPGFWDELGKLMMGAVGLPTGGISEGMWELITALYQDQEQALDTADATDTLADKIKELQIKIDDTTLDTELYTNTLATMNTEMNRLKTISSLNTDIRYMTMGLQEASYAVKIQNMETKNLVDSLRMQRDAIEALNRVNQEYSIQEQENNLIMEKIQLNAMNRRGRMTRYEKNQMKQIEQANMELRIKTMENQIEIEKKQMDLSPMEKRFNELQLWYNEEVYLTQDTYNREINALQQKIDAEKALYNQSILDKQEYLRQMADLSIPIIQTSGRIGLTETATRMGSNKTENNINVKVDATIQNQTGIDNLANLLAKAVSARLIKGVDSAYRVG